MYFDEFLRINLHSESYRQGIETYKMDSENMTDWTVIEIAADVEKK